MTLPAPVPRPTLVVGAGDVGAQLAHRLLQSGAAVCLYDDLARDGARENVRRLRAIHGDAFPLMAAAFDKPRALARAARGARAIYHVAAHPLVLLDVIGRPEAAHTVFATPAPAARLVDEVRGRRLPAAVLRTSAVYGPPQSGEDEDDWVAHAARGIARHRPVTLRGDALVRRDLLFLDDLVDALLATQARLPDLAGAAFDVGGGHEHAASALEVAARLGDGNGLQPDLTFEPGPETGPIADIRPLQAATGWRPRVGLAEGLARLREAVADSLDPAPRVRRRRRPARTAAAMLVDRPPRATVT